jgi:peptide subunit release factor RF-3
LLAAVGPLQFEVVQFRLESEYGAASRLEAAPWTVVRWLPVDMKEDDLDALSLPTGARVAYDMGKNPVVLFQNEWSANYFTENQRARAAVRVARANGEGVNHGYTRMSTIISASEVTVRYNDHHRH